MPTGTVGRIACGLAFAVAFLVVKNSVQGQQALTGAELDAMFDKAFTQAEAIAVPTFPKKLNELTTQIGMSHHGRVITYTYQLNYEKADLDNEPGYFNRMKSNTARQACARPSMRRDLNDGMKMHYVYQDRHGGPLGEFVVSGADC